jgi:hypothetical protein
MPMEDTFAAVKGRSRILYLHPPKPPLSVRSYVGAGGVSPYWQLPVGVLGMMNLLKSSGYQVTGLNVPLEIAIDHRFDLHAWLESQQDVGLIAIDLHCPVAGSPAAIVVVGPGQASNGSGSGCGVTLEVSSCRPRGSRQWMRPAPAAPASVNSFPCLVRRDGRYLLATKHGLRPPCTAFGLL